MSMPSPKPARRIHLGPCSPIPSPAAHGEVLPQPGRQGQPANCLRPQCSQYLRRDSAPFALPQPTHHRRLRSASSPWLGTLRPQPSHIVRLLKTTAPSASPQPAHLGATYRRTVSRIYGDAKGLVVWY
jgi:hypothetical protein